MRAYIGGVSCWRWEELCYAAGLPNRLVRHHGFGMRPEPSFTYNNSNQAAGNSSQLTNPANEKVNKFSASITRTRSRVRSMRAGHRVLKPVPSNSLLQQKPAISKNLQFVTVTVVAGIIKTVTGIVASTYLWSGDSLQ
jgi:hypothetical protein